MAAAPTFSFIIVCFNNREILSGCLGSIYANAQEFDFEIIISDNGSRDGSVDFIRERWPDIKIIENGRNLGFAAAVNRGISIARGEYIVLMNSDAELTLGALDSIFRFMAAHPDTAVAGGRLIDPDGSSQNSAAAFPGMATELGGKSVLKLLFPGRYPGRTAATADPFDVDSIIGALMVVRTDAIRRVGTLDEDYFFFLEETDWCLRMKRAGFRVMVVPEAGVIHHQGKTAKRYPISAKIEYYRSLVVFMKKNRSRLYAGFFILGLLVKFIVSFIIQALFCLFTLFLVRGPRDRCARYATLIVWMIGGRPKSWGLSAVEYSGD